MRKNDAFHNFIQSDPNSGAVSCGYQGSRLGKRQGSMLVQKVRKVPSKETSRYALSLTNERCKNSCHLSREAQGTAREHSFCWKFNREILNSINCMHLRFGLFSHSRRYLQVLISSNAPSSLIKYGSLYRARIAVSLSRLSSQVLISVVSHTRRRM